MSLNQGIYKTPLPSPENKPGGSSGLPNSAFLLIAIILLIFIGWYGLNTLEWDEKQRLADTLQTVLNANVEALKVWSKDEREDVEIWANHDETRGLILNILEKSKKFNWTRRQFLQSKELLRLRQILEPVCKKKGLMGFVVVRADGVQIAALLDQVVGNRDLISRSDFIKRSLQGETVLSVPIPGEVALPATKDIWKLNWPTMFASAPVKNDSGKIVAVLAFRIRPETKFTRVLEISRAGNSGETYAFDAKGLMISDSRFNSHLRQVGLLPNHPDSRAILNIQVRDPGGNLLEGYKPSVPRNRQPLTLMAANAIQGQTGFNIEGYNDYRGVPVVGAWTWLAEYGFGIASEMDVEEAFVSYNNVTSNFLILFGLLTMATALFLFQQAKKVGLEREKIRSEEKEKITQSSLREKEVLLQEIHHRAKNNLQIITSLLQLQSKEINDKKYSAMLQESNDRIKSIAVMHDLILQSPDLSEINLSHYMRTIADNLICSYGYEPEDIDLEIQAEGISLDIDTSIHCGLIVNELVSNSLKHAFDKDQKKKIRIEFKFVKPNTYVLSVKDNGRGLPANFDPKNSKTLGMQLVTTLAEEQLGGSLNIRNQPGSEFIITFSAPAKRNFTAT